MLLARQQRTHRICTPGAGSRGVFEGGVYKGSEAPSTEFLSNRRHRHRGMAASNPLHRDASASRQPSTHSLHGITASNAALPSHKVEGLVGPLRPLSGSRSCGAPPRPLPLPFAHALRAAIRTLTAARARAVRVQPCHRILEATTMRRTAGIENKMRTRVERRETGSDYRDLLPPHQYVPCQ